MVHAFLSLLCFPVTLLLIIASLKYNLKNDFYERRIISKPVCVYFCHFILSQHQVIPFSETLL
jgi:hypothetical protein